MSLKYCRECGKQVSSEASSCPHCGAPWPTGPNEAFEVAAYEQRRAELRTSTSSFQPGIAAVLSLIIPGAGQMYKGHVGRGLAWLIFTVVGYMAFIIPGVILHLACIIGAATRD